MIDSKYSVDRKPVVSTLATDLATDCYGMLRYATDQTAPSLNHRLLVQSSHPADAMFCTMFR